MQQEHSEKDTGHQKNSQWPPDLRPAQDLERERDRDIDLEEERDGDRPSDCFWELEVGCKSSSGLLDLEWLFLLLGRGLEGEEEWDAERLREPGSWWVLW